MTKEKLPALVGTEEVIARANALLPAADRGDARAQAELRELLDGTPELWAGVGNLAAQAERSAVASVAARNPVVAEAITRKLAALRRELRGEEPSPLERLLVDRVVAGWLAIHHAEASYHQRLAQGLARAEAEYLERRLERAQRRYLAAIKALTTVRRLLGPAIQVNVAERQINLAR